MTTVLGSCLLEVAEAIDLPEEAAARAIAEYQAIGEWLGAAESGLSTEEPDIYPQGSFRLGTPVAPISSAEGFDIDLVCKLDREKDATTQKALRDDVGARLREHEEYSKILKPRRRCWTLAYPGQFHLDVLPSIPDRERGGTGILLTDRELTRWQHSNPIGYAEWFFGRDAEALKAERERAALERGVTIEEVEYSTLRTPLQRVVQLLKRHRDIAFAERPALKPVSIIVTTLAAHAYGGENDLDSAMSNVCRLMAGNIERRGDKWWVRNPAHPDENFADKWNEDDGLRQAFMGWLEGLQAALRAFGGSQDAECVRRGLRAEFWRRGESDFGRRVALVPPVGDASHAERVPWRESPSYRVKIRGWLYSKKRGGKRLWELRNGGVPKGMGLKFVAETSTPEPYDVMWQVINTGPEAASAHGLRGDFYESERGARETRWESTQYAGQHWIEAFVLKSGVCVGRSGRFAVRIVS